MFLAVLTKELTYMDGKTNHVRTLPAGEKVVISTIKPGSVFIKDDMSINTTKEESYLVFHKNLFMGRGALTIRKNEFKTID